MTIDGQVCYDDGESGEDPKCIAYDMSKDGASCSVFAFPFLKHRVIANQQLKIIFSGPVQQLDLT